MPLRRSRCYLREPHAGVRDLAASVTWEQLQQSGAVICGTPEQCVDRIRELHDSLGFTQLLCWTRLGGLDQRKVIRSMELMQDRVMPRLREPMTYEGWMAAF